VLSVAWSPDGAYLASASGDNTVRVWRWDTTTSTGTGDELARLNGHTRWVSSVAWSPDGAYLASASGDNTVRVSRWDTTTSTGSELARLNGHTSWVRSVAWSPDGAYLASASADGTVRVWRWDTATGTGSELARLDGHTDWVWSVAWSPDGAYLASASGDNTVACWSFGVLAPTSAVAVVSNDSVHGVDDRLGIRRDVLSLAQLVTARSVVPPVSVGLFADWGGGKTYFMEELDREIRKLAGSRHPSYCAAVTPIWFNAWHYRDSDLWASLAARVFEVLAADASASQVFAGVSPRAAEAALRQVESELVEARRRLEIVTDRGGFGAGLRRAVASALDPDTAQRWAARSAGVRYELGILAVVVGELCRKTHKRVLLFGVGLVVLGATAGATGFLAQGWVTGFLPWREVLQRVLPLASTAFGVVTVMGVALKAAVETASTVWSKARPAIDKAAAAQRREREHLEAKVADLIDRRTELTETRNRTSATEQLRAHVTARADSADYTTRLGIINTIRSDFEQMSALLPQAVEERDDGVERIVLFIDDLDRCPAKRVVEVLEAIHLILALPLFVVVVAVDPRWLVRALETQYQDLLANVNPQNEDDGGLSAESHWTASPLSYLEKIIQIPYTLRPMDSAGFANLVAAELPVVPAARPVDLTAGNDTTRQPANPVADHTSSRPANEDQRHGGSHQDPIASDTIPITGPTSLHELRRSPLVLRPDPQPVEVTAAEVDFLKELGPLVSTPRAAKKLANIYRLLRAGLTPSRRTIFVEDGGFYAAAILLAAVIGRPLRAYQLIRDIEDTSADIKLRDFVERPTPIVDLNYDTMTNSNTSNFYPNERTPHRQLRDDIKVIISQTSAKIPVERLTMGQLQYWIDDTARFSFHTGRLLAHPRSPQSHLTATTTGDKPETEIFPRAQTSARRSHRTT
jgi:hypothetical protein